MTAIRVTSGVTITTEAEELDSIELRRDATLNAPNLVAIRSGFFSDVGAMLNAPRLQSASSITIGNAAGMTLPSLVSGGTIALGADSRLTCERLQEGGQVSLGERAILTAPACYEVAEVELYHGAQLNAARLEKVRSRLLLHVDAVLRNSLMKEVGYCDLRNGSKLDAAGLLTCGDVYLECDAGFYAPVHQVGSLYLSPSVVLELALLERVEGELGLGQGAHLTAPRLTWVAEDLMLGAKAKFVVRAGDPTVGGRMLLDPTADWLEFAGKVSRVKI